MLVSFLKVVRFVFAIIFGGKKIYAKILGFVPTELTDRTYIVKSIDPSWTKDGLGFTWNSPSRLRCFWATSLSVETDDIYPDYSNVQDKFINPFSFNEAKGKMGEKYCLENTSSTNHTKLLVVAQLMDGTGADANTVEIAEWNGTRCLLSELPARIAGLLKDEIYTDEEGTTAVNGTNIEFKPVDQNIAKGRYAVTPKLKDATYYKKNGEEVTALSSTELANYNSSLAKAPTMIWKDGHCYYYVDIKHYGSENKPGEYGVVRNHVYKTSVTKVVGLGTPVFDPTLPIIPELPAEKYSYIAARINILSWHIVNNSVILGK